MLIHIKKVSLCSVYIFGLHETAVGQGQNLDRACSVLYSVDLLATAVCIRIYGRVHSSTKVERVLDLEPTSRALVISSYSCTCD